MSCKYCQGGRIAVEPGSSQTYECPDCRKNTGSRLDVADCCTTLKEAQGVIRRHEERMADMLEWCYELRSAWAWKKDEPRAGNKAEYDQLCADIDGVREILLVGSRTPE